MKNTGNYKLKKPEGTDTVNIEDLNYNADIIDNEIVKRALKADMPTNLNQFTNGPGFITSSGAPVQSVNGKTGTLILSASDVGAETPTGSEAKVNALAGLNNTKTVKQVSDDLIVLNQSVEAHKADYVKHPGYATTTGVANTYIATLSPAPTSYADGIGIVAKINVASTGASTININGLGVKPILDSLGNAITAGGLKANTPYTMRYNGTSFIVQGKGGGGNALIGDLRLGKTATVDSGQITGALDLSNLLSQNILNGVSIDGVAGSVIAGKRRVIGSIPSGFVINNTDTFVVNLGFTPNYIILNSNYAGHTSDIAGVYKVNTPIVIYHPNGTPGCYSGIQFNNMGATAPILKFNSYNNNLYVCFTDTGEGNQPLSGACSFIVYE